MACHYEFPPQVKASQGRQFSDRRSAARRRLHAGRLHGRTEPDRQDRDRFLERTKYLPAAGEIEAKNFDVTRGAAAESGRTWVCSPSTSRKRTAAWRWTRSPPRWWPNRSARTPASPWPSARTQASARCRWSGTAPRSKSRNICRSSRRASGSPRMRFPKRRRVRTR